METGNTGFEFELSILRSCLFSLQLTQRKKKKKVIKPELFIQERLQRLAKFQTIAHGKNKCIDLLAGGDASIQAQLACVFLGWLSKMELPWEGKDEGTD